MSSSSSSSDSVTARVVCCQKCGKCKVDAHSSGGARVSTHCTDKAITINGKDFDTRTLDGVYDYDHKKRSLHKIRNHCDRKEKS